MEEGLIEENKTIKHLTRLSTALPPLNIDEELKRVQTEFEAAVKSYRNISNGKEMSPVNHIAFLKVHKSASTTAQNIFLRYGLVRNLTFVLPIVPNDFFENVISIRESITSSNIFPPPKNGSFDILCCHVIYDNNAFRKTMPADTAYIGIVRHPFTHFQSAVSYFFPHNNFTNMVSEFLKHPWIFNIVAPRKHYFNNRQAVEFGFPEETILKRNKSSIINYLSKLDKEFLVVLIVEYFEESVLLMKRLLNWSLKDILYLTRNKTPESKKESYSPLVGDFTNLKQWSSVDYDLYYFFYKRLRRQIQEQGIDFYDELLHFKEIQRRVEIFCNNHNRPNKIIVEQSNWDNLFTVTSLDCLLMQISEIEFVRYLRKRQYPYGSVQERHNKSQTKGLHK